MSGKHFNPEALRKVATDLERAAVHVDASEAARPTTLDAGPLTPILTEMVHQVVADSANLVMRLIATGETLRDVGERQEADERGNVEDLEGFLRDLAGGSDTSRGGGSW
jgi:hypothetical protein